MNFGTMAESDAVTIMLSKIQSAKNFHSIHCSRALDFSTPDIVHPWVMTRHRKIQFLGKAREFNRKILVQ